MSPTCVDFPLLADFVGRLQADYHWNVIGSTEGTMTPEQVTLVQSSFKSIAPIASKAADLFYDRLFEIAPEVRPLFPADLSNQKVKPGAMLATAVTLVTR